MDASIWWLRATVRSRKFFVPMMNSPIRVAAYIDGFNLYHAILNAGQSHLKWLDLHRLCGVFAPAPQYELVGVNYFSAFATWLTSPYRRHQVYTSALSGSGVRCIMGQFKEKPQECRSCGSRWVGHEEKESDVALGVHLVADAFLDLYDKALIMTADNDVCPALRTVRRHFPHKSIQVLTPPGQVMTNELRGASGKRCKPIKWFHIERSLFDREVYDPTGRLVATRPTEYDPPS